MVPWLNTHLSCAEDDTLKVSKKLADPYTQAQSRDNDRFNGLLFYLSIIPAMRLQSWLLYSLSNDFNRYVKQSEKSGRFVQQ